MKADVRAVGKVTPWSMVWVVFFGTQLGEFGGIIDVCADVFTTRAGAERHKRAVEKATGTVGRIVMRRVDAPSYTGAS